jgi:DNA-binding HxlR family transcriptional regulator
MAVSSTENAPGEPIAMDVLRPDCPSRVVMQRIGERWSMFVILALADGPLRFTAVKARVGVVTSKVLTETLRALEADGLIARQAYAESPPRVEYDLTPLGASLLVPLAGMRAWAEAHVPEVLASRERHLVTP